MAMSDESKLDRSADLPILPVGRNLYNILLFSQEHRIRPYTIYFAIPVPSSSSDDYPILKENSEFCLTRAQNMEFGTQAAWTRQERKMQNEKDDTLVPFLSLSPEGRRR